MPVIMAAAKPVLLVTFGYTSSPALCSFLLVLVRFTPAMVIDWARSLGEDLRQWRFMIPILKNI